MLRKIINIVATRCQILRLKCIKFDFEWGSAPEPTWWAYSAPQDSLAGFKGTYSYGKGKKGKGEEGREERVEFHHLLLSNLTTGQTCPS